jgi:hypothetical protein
MCWSSLLSTKIPLLIDEAVPGPLAAAISSSSGISSVQYVRDIRVSAFNNARSVSDEQVVEYAKKRGQVVVTTETGINEKSFPICQHKGIIVFCGARRHDENRAEMFKKFLLSGERAKALDSVTYLSESKVRIKTHAGDLPDISL